MIAALENYVKVAEDYVKKYGSPFNLNKDSGETKNVKMLSTVKEEIEAKISLSKDTVEKMKGIN